MNPYNEIGADQILSPKHVNLATEAARKSFVLLKNDRDTLPLLKDEQRDGREGLVRIFDVKSVAAVVVVVVVVVVFVVVSVYLDDTSFSTMSVYRSDGQLQRSVDGRLFS